jgi:branched-chain amino acid aminotransferase
MVTESLLVDAAARPGGESTRAAWLWRSGELVAWAEARVHVNAVGQASAAAVFEGIRAYPAADGRLLVFRLADHLRRLADSARICRLDLGHDTEQLAGAVLELLRVNGYAEPVYVRPWAFPAGHITEQMVPAGTRCEVVIDTWPVGTDLAATTGCRAAVSSWRRISDAAMPPLVKAFANYHNGRLAVVEARENGHDWPILLNDRHQVSEGAGACVALIRDGVLVTPTLTSDVLAGITRHTVLRIARDCGIPVEEREVSRTELYLADELFFMGTSWELLPIVAIDGLAVGAGTVGPVTERLRAQYTRVVRGEVAGYAGWLTEVPR